MVDKIPADKYFAPEYTVQYLEFSAQRQRKTVLKSAGFTLVELIVVVAILVVLVATAIPTFNKYVNTTKVGTSATDLRQFENAITAYILDKNVLPPDLTAVGMGNRLDPWKRPYEYKNHSDVGAIPLEDRFGVDLNTDYDLYSKGEDGASAEISPNPINEDDVVRVNEGSFFGVRPNP